MVGSTTTASHSPIPPTTASTSEMNSLIQA
jgi:hypothetical protein